MAGFEDYVKDALDIEAELVRKGIALGIDWSNDGEVRALAHAALNHLDEDTKVSVSTPIDHQKMARIDLFGLAGLMLKTMEESAGYGFESHGGPAWKAFAKALWAEARLKE
ncbi:MAG: hypothetical protein WAV95_00845 [Azonexus sp.]